MTYWYITLISDRKQLVGFHKGIRYYTTDKASAKRFKRFADALAACKSNEITTSLI